MARFAIATTPRRKFALALTAAVALAGGTAALAQMMGQGMHMHGQGGMMNHDEANMPGLQGANATPEESAELAVMFRNFETLTREVTELPDGIRTVTRSSTPR